MNPIRVLSFESRKAAEMRSLIERNGAEPTVVPSMREVSLGITEEIREFVERLQSGTLDTIVFLTGVGAESLATAIESELPHDRFCELLNQTTIVVRGPKPFAVMKKWDVRVDARAEEPNTWEELIPAVESVFADRPGGLGGLRVAIQEYGVPSQQLYEALEERGASVLPVPVYRWALPEDMGPLKESIAQIANGEGVDLILITTAQQVVHVIQTADELGLKDRWLEAAAQTRIASIGPTASERIREFGLHVDFEPSHPHMGHLVRESIQWVSSQRSQPD